MSEVVEQSNKGASGIGRFIVLVYGVIGYFLGVVGLVAIVALASGLLPIGYLAMPSLGSPILDNVVLVALWGLVHSVMARDSFKSVLTRFIPEPAERPTYVLIAGVTSLLMVGLWQQVPGIIWSAQAPGLVTFLWIMFGFGWLCLGPFGPV